VVRSALAAVDMRGCAPICSVSGTSGQKCPKLRGAVPVPPSGRHPLLGIRRQQRERPALQRRYGAKMALVEAEKATGFIALRKDRDRAIGKTEAEIGVAGVELRDHPVIAGFQARDVIAPCGEIAEEGTSGRMAEADAEQIVDLGRNRSRQRGGGPGHSSHTAIPFQDRSRSSESPSPRDAATPDRYVAPSGPRTGALRLKA
jgi:hypothetical protein